MEFLLQSGALELFISELAEVLAEQQWQTGTMLIVGADEGTTTSATTAEAEPPHFSAQLEAEAAELVRALQRLVSHAPVLEWAKARCQGDTGLRAALAHASRLL